MNHKIILLVEDNPDDAALTLDAFQECKIPHVMVVVNDGVDALEYLFRTGAYAERPVEATPSLVLLDLKMPKVDGLSVLKRIRSTEAMRRMPVVVLTSSRERQDMLTSYDLGANSYIRKPVNYDQFLEVVHQLCIYWLQINEQPPVRP